MAAIGSQESIGIPGSYRIPGSWNAGEAPGHRNTWQPSDCKAHLGSHTNTYAWISIEILGQLQEYLVTGSLGKLTWAAI